MKALRCGDLLIPWHCVSAVDCSQLASLTVTLRCRDGDHVAHGNDAIEVVLAVAPSALEGKRLTWVRGQWALHNLVGHPVMQLLAWLRRYRAALWIHDWTVPRPRSPPST